jgi:hypothetical protein
MVPGKCPPRSQRLSSELTLLPILDTAQDPIREGAADPIRDVTPDFEETCLISTWKFKKLLYPWHQPSKIYLQQLKDFLFGISWLLLEIQGG